MRVLKVDFSKRTDRDLIPLTARAVLRGVYEDLAPDDEVLIWDDDLEVLGTVVRSGNYKNACSWVRPRWETVRFRTAGQLEPRSLSAS